MSNQRQSYHSDFKLAVQLDCVPSNILSRIPRSSRHRFKYSDYSTLYGSELSSLFENMDLIKEIAQSKAALHTARAVLRIASFVRLLSLGTVVVLAEIQGFSGFSAFPYTHSRSGYEDVNSVPRLPLTVVDVPIPTSSRFRNSGLSRRPFSDPDFAPWPASSIAWKLIHERIVSASVATITGYAKLLGFSHRKPVHRSRKRGSIAASFPNEAWHLDATIIMTESHEKAYLQFILDNYSKRIIAWQGGDSISGFRTTELLKSAFGSLSSSRPEHIDLIVDGGPENNNRLVSAYLEDTPIRKLVARVDVSFSNSMIEAVNKILKYRYIFRTPVPDLDHVNQTIADAIEDYNDRPHYALNGLTPNQVYSGLPSINPCIASPCSKPGTGVLG